MKNTCYYCNGTKKIEVPENQEEFDRWFDIYDNNGSLDTHTCRSRALKKSGYTLETCPKCCI